MPRAVLIVMTNPIDDSREAEYNEWYTNTHLSDVLKVPGFVAATRYRLSSKQLRGSAPEGTHRYLAIYEVDSDDLASVNAGLIKAASEGMVISEALDGDTASTLLFEQITERVEA